MSKSASTSIATQEGSSYIRKLCRHFSHKADSSYSETEGVTYFPFGTARMKATADMLQFDIDSDSFEGISQIKYVLVTHLEKFAHKESLRIHWVDTPPSPDPDWQELGRQLRQPEGENGVKTGISMNRSNWGMILKAAQLLDLRAGDTVLEIGPGNGAHIPQVLKGTQDIDYTGIDISATMIEEAKKATLSLSGIRFMLTDGKSLPFADHSFDKIFTVNTLYFWENPLDYATRIKAVLKPGGIFCLAFATEEFMKRLPFTKYGFRLYSVEEVEKLLRQARFEVYETIAETETVRSNTGEKIARDIAFIRAGHTV